MRGKPITKKEISKIIRLRKTGHSLPEIVRALQRGSSTVFKYTKDVEIPSPYLSQLKIKRGGSRKRANKAWGEARLQADKRMSRSLSADQRLYLLVGLYWGEGNKTELNLINSDPGLIKTFISCLSDLGIRKDQIKIGLRIHDDIRAADAIDFWSHLLSINASAIRSIEIIKGKKTAKLRYGMCRVRVAKSAPYFKLLISLINKVKDSFNAAVVQRIEQGTPKP